MATIPFEAAARHRDGVAVIDLRGEIDRGAEEALNTAYVRAVDDDPAAILLNFNDVEYINSTGIALIVGLLARARKEGRSITAYGLSDHYKEIFQITRLSDFMAIFDDEESAVTELPT